MRRRDGGIILHSVGVVLMAAGCSAPPVEESNLDRAVEDRNGNGFAEVAPPVGISFEEEGSINALVSNTVTRDDLARIAAEFGLDPALVQATDIVIFYTLELTYPDGTVDVQEDSERIEPFEKRLEFACPDTVKLDFEVIAFPPLLEPESLLAGSLAAADGAEFECGQTINVEAFIDETGQPDFDVSLTD